MSVRSALPWLIGLAVLAILPTLFPGRAAITLLNQMAITVVLALAYNMLLGQGGMLSFGHAIYAGLGGYAAIHLLARIEDGALSLPLPVVPLVAGLFVGAMTALIGLFSLRRAGTSFAMISLGVGELFAAAALIFVAFSGGEDGLSADRTYASLFGISFGAPVQVYWVVAAWTWAAALAMYLFTRTPAGHLARAVRENPERVAHLGFDPAAVRYRTFCASGGFAGLAGGLFAITYEFAGPETLTLEASGQILLATYLGGIGVFWGPILGAVVFTLLQSVVSFHTALWQLYLGLASVGAVLFFPKGLAGALMGMKQVHWPGLLQASGIALAAAGCIGLLELYHHRQTGDLETGPAVVFALPMPSVGITPWVIFAGLFAAGSVMFVLARRKGAVR